jgi:hypothetical protein
VDELATLRAVADRARRDPDRSFDRKIGIEIYRWLGAERGTNAINVAILARHHGHVTLDQVREQILSARRTPMALLRALRACLDAQRAELVDVYDSDLVGLLNGETVAVWRGRA